MVTSGSKNYSTVLMQTLHIGNWFALCKAQFELTKVLLQC